MKFIFKRLRRHWQSLRCLITPFPSASRKAVRKIVDWEASYGRTRELFWQLVGKSLTGFGTKQNAELFDAHLLQQPIGRQ